MTSVTIYKFKDESTSEIPRDGVSSDLSLDWELVNMLSKILTEAEFSILMFEHFVGFPPSGGTRNYAHGGKGPFRTSY